jgi:hypothetical protein
MVASVACVVAVAHDELGATPSMWALVYFTTPCRPHSIIAVRAMGRRIADLPPRT